MRAFRKFLTSNGTLFVLVVVMPMAAVIYFWRESLGIAALISILVGFLTIFFTVYSQREVLRENLRQQMSYEAYKELLPVISDVEDALSALMRDLRRLNLQEQQKLISKVTGSFINAYLSHEMVFVSRKKSFYYIYDLLMRLNSTLFAVDTEVNNSHSVYGEKIYSVHAQQLFDTCKEASMDLGMYFHDLRKDLIQELDFADIMHTRVERRKPRDKKYKQLSEVATQQALDAFENNPGRLL